VQEKQGNNAEKCQQSSPRFIKEKRIAFVRGREQGRRGVGINSSRRQNAKGPTTAPKRNSRQARTGKKNSVLGTRRERSRNVPFRLASFVWMIIAVARLKSAIAAASDGRVHKSERICGAKRASFPNRWLYAKKGGGEASCPRRSDAQKKKSRPQGPFRDPL